MNTELRKIQIMTLKNIFFKLMNIVVFGKTIKNVRAHRDIKLITVRARRNYLVSKPRTHTTISSDN